MKVVEMFSDSSWTIILIDIVGSDQVCVYYMLHHIGEEERKRVSTYLFK